MLCIICLVILRQPHLTSFQVLSPQPQKDLEMPQCELLTPPPATLTALWRAWHGRGWPQIVGRTQEKPENKGKQCQEWWSKAWEREDTAGLAIMLTWVVRGADIRVPAEILLSFQQQQNTRGE